MINVVLSSLPYIADRSVIQKKLEDANLDLDAVVESLLEEKQPSSSPSSRQGSSSIERDHDSDEDDICGPNKKQDRRLSRATRTAIKEKEEQRKHDLAVRMKDRSLAATKESSSPPAISINDIKLHDSDETEEEDWKKASSFKDSESTSVSTSISDNSAPISTRRSGGVRLKLSQPKKDHEKLQRPVKTSHKSTTASDGKSTAQPNDAPSATNPTRRRRLYRRDELDMKKLAQKAAAKERKKSNTTRARGQDGVVPLTKSIKENTPAVEARIKVLCI